MQQISQLELFRSTVKHQWTGSFLFEIDFVPDLKERVLSFYKVDTMDELRSRLNIPSIAQVNLEPPKTLKTESSEEEQERLWNLFGDYYNDIERPPGSYLSPRGVLKVPSNF